eukprot:767599-Hanusia_phi.AAC.2
MKGRRKRGRTEGSLDSELVLPARSWNTQVDVEGIFDDVADLRRDENSMASRKGARQVERREAREMKEEGREAVDQNEGKGEAPDAQEAAGVARVGGGNGGLDDTFTSPGEDSVRKGREE